MGATMSADYGNWLDLELDRQKELQAFKEKYLAASPAVRDACWRFLRGGHVLAAAASVDERSAWLLAALAPSKLRWPALDVDDPDDDLDDLDDKGD
jgi:hypothetical protein